MPEDQVLVAHLDESKREVPRVTPATHHYAVAAVLTLEGDVEVADRLRECAEQERLARLHYQDLGSSRKLVVAQTMAGIPGWQGVVVASDRAAHLRHDRTPRDALLGALLRELSLIHGIRRAVIESRNRPGPDLGTLDCDDLATLDRLRAAVTFALASASSTLGRASPCSGSRTSSRPRLRRGW